MKMEFWFIQELGRIQAEDRVCGGFFLSLELYRFCLELRFMPDWFQMCLVSVDEEKIFNLTRGANE